MAQLMLIYLVSMLDLTACLFGWWLMAGAGLF
jgi:hypothetical protein